jgi:hypothetical protein
LKLDQPIVSWLDCFLLFSFCFLFYQFVDFVKLPYWLFPSCIRQQRPRLLIVVLIQFGMKS